MTTCKSCQTEMALKYCPACGQAATLKRIDGHYILHEIEHVLHFDKGILYTIRELALRPGKNVRTFLAEDRGRLVKPVIFIIATSLIYTFLSHAFHVEPTATYSAIKQSTAAVILKWTEDHMGYANIIMGAFIALWLKLFFRKQPYNYFEIIILLCFVMGFAMLIYSLFVVIQGLLHTDLMQLASWISISYCAWALGRFFDPQKPVAYVKSFFAYLLGMLTYTGLAVALGMVIDVATRH